MNTSEIMITIAIWIAIFLMLLFGADTFDRRTEK